MRLTDVFLSIPPLVLAMSITGFLEPSAIHGMIAITAMWWPWYARLAYNLTRAERQEGYVVAAEIVGAVFRTFSFAKSCRTACRRSSQDDGRRRLCHSHRFVNVVSRSAPRRDARSRSMVADGAKYMPDACG